MRRFVHFIQVTFICLYPETVKIRKKLPYHGTVDSTTKGKITIYAEEYNTKHISFGDISCACFLGQQTTHGMFIQMIGSSS